MQIYLREKIGRPELFTGRNKEISDLLNWVHRIEKEISQSTAILSRRKTGKTALLQRLYNIVFHENKNIIPFYYEIRETDQWLMDDLRAMLPGRFKVKPLENMPKHEVIEMIYKYSNIESIPVKEETAFIMAGLCEGNPFYISALFRSEFQGKNFTGMDGLLKTLEFETISQWGAIKGTWMEYVNAALSKINDRNAKKIVLYLCQNKDREVTRKELHDRLNLEMSHAELEVCMDALVKSDIIIQGSSNFDYQAVQDNIFDKVFRSVYQKEINVFDPKEITNEYKALYRKISGEYNKFKGEFSEYVVINILKYKACKNSNFYKSMINNLPDDFNFEKYHNNMVIQGFTGL